MMRTNLIALMLCVSVRFFLSDAVACFRYYEDIAVESPSGRYKVEAKSPHNADPEKRLPFQHMFVYTFQDMATKNVIWTRRQATETRKFDDGGEYQASVEGSPERIFVSDSGWTVIWTGQDELIVLDVLGTDRCIINLLEEGFTSRERNMYVHETTVGPKWASFTLWYFLDVGNQHLFVIRPWWGRRIIVDLDASRLIRVSSELESHAEDRERAIVLADLDEAIQTRSVWEQSTDQRSIRSTLTACYVAGSLGIKESIPLLRKLQDCEFVSGIVHQYPEQPGEGVNPFVYQKLIVRQVVHLSLRRLGQIPGAYSATRFEVSHRGSEERIYYVPEPPSLPRIAGVDKVTCGMKPKEVLDILGGPDFVSGGAWEYDVVAEDSYTLSIEWKDRGVLSIRKRYPRWNYSYSRDMRLHFLLW